MIIIHVSYYFESNLFHFPDEGDEVVPNGLADDLERKVPTLYVAMNQPLG